MYLTFSFRKNLNKGKYSIYRNLLHVSLLTHSPLSRTCRSKSFLPLVASSVLMVKDNFVRLYLCKVKRSLKPYQNEKKATKNMSHWPENFHENLVPLASHLPCLSSNPKILKALRKTFPTKVKPTINAQQEKKRKEKQKAKHQDCCVTFKPKTSKFCFLSQWPENRSNNFKMHFPAKSPGGWEMG